MGGTATRASSISRPRVVDWRGGYARRLATTDLIVLIWVVFGVQIAWFGFDTRNATLSTNLNDMAINYTGISVAVIFGWMAILGVFGTRGHRVVGVGAAEYKLIIGASLRLFGSVAIVAFLVKLDLARGYILLAFPLGILVLLFTRWLWRQWLAVERSMGRYSATVLLVGSVDSVAHIARELQGQPSAGYHVVGACVPGGKVTGALAGMDVTVYGTVDSVVEALEATGADTVIITSADELPPVRVREISWSLEAGRQHLVVAPSLTDIGGPRIHTRPVAGLPLIHVEMPTFEGLKKFEKRSFDFVGASLLLLFLSPLLLILAILVKASSAGPVFYRQERVGRAGETFKMLKFRSMIVDADEQLAALLAQQGSHDRPLFKVRDDPRLTKVGAILRKYSLDEFPQLINVLRGDMSLVGPRPQREGEVALYDDAAHRRLMVQPGMTGLWQVSGRSALSWEDAIRLDLYYVENWSTIGDLVIMWRTLKAVLAPGEEAY